MAYAELWTLNGKMPEACLDLERWARWFERADLVIARDELLDGELVIVTRFRAFVERRGKFDPPPLLFETVVLGESHDGEIARVPTTRRARIETRSYATWDEAERGHAEIVERYQRMADVIGITAAGVVSALTPRAREDAEKK